MVLKIAFRHYSSLSLRMGLHFKLLPSKEYSKNNCWFVFRLQENIGIDGCNLLGTVCWQMYDFSLEKWTNVCLQQVWNQWQTKVAFPQKSNLANRCVYWSCLQEYGWEITHKNMDNSKIYMYQQKAHRAWLMPHKSCILGAPWVIFRQLNRSDSILSPAVLTYYTALEGKVCVANLVSFRHFQRLVSCLPWTLFDLLPQS